MATSIDYIEYVKECLSDFSGIEVKKMFGEYLLYINSKPILLICDDTVYVKMIPAIEPLLKNALTGPPYPGAKQHYILDLDDSKLLKKVILALEEAIPLPKPNKKKN